MNIQSENISQVDCGVPDSFREVYRSFHQNVSMLKLSKEFTIPRAPQQRDCAYEQLTQIGVIQHIKLGSFLRSRYRDKHRLLTDHWQTNQLQTFFTNTTRTFQSALSFLYGFAPEIFSSDRKIDLTLVRNLNFCFNNDYCDCPVIHVLTGKINKFKENLTEGHPAIINLLAFFRKIITGLRKQVSPINCFDAMSLMSCHEHFYPCDVTTGSCISAKHLQRLTSYIEWSGAKLSDNTDYQKQSRLKMHGFFIHLLENMLASVVSQKKDSGIHPKFILYSGHDINVKPVLVSLGLGNHWLVPYGSRIVFELYSKKLNENKNNFYVRFLFNGKDITRFISFCKEFWAQPNISYNTVRCPLGSFIDFVNHSHLRLMKATTFASACENDQQDLML